MTTIFSFVRRRIICKAPLVTPIAIKTSSKHAVRLNNRPISRVNHLRSHWNIKAEPGAQNIPPSLTRSKMAWKALFLLVTLPDGACSSARRSPRARKVVIPQQCHFGLQTRLSKKGKSHLHETYAHIRSEPPMMPFGGIKTAAGRISVHLACVGDT